MDTHLQGMVYAVVARPPVLSGKLRSVRSEKALQVPGVLKVLEIPSYSGAPAFQALGGVAVVASNTWSAMQGRAALEIEWDDGPNASRSDEHTSELQSLMRISYAVFCLTKQRRNRPEQL